MNVNSKILTVGLALLIVTSTLPSGLMGTANAQSASNRYTVIQGNNCWEVTPYQPGDPNPEMQGDEDDTIKPHVEVIERSHELGEFRSDSWDGTPTIESVMDYRYRDGIGGVHDNQVTWGPRERYSPWLDEDYRAEGWDFGTYGLWNWSENQESHVFFYNGPEGDSVVFRHDKLYDSTPIGSHDPYNGMNGPREGFMSPQPGRSAATFIFRDLPSGEWAYLDDLYPEDMDSIYYASGEYEYNSSRHTRFGTYHNDYDAAPLSTYDGGTDFTAHWTWGDNGTDGGAYRGLQNLAPGESITIEPYFDEESYFWSNYWWRYDQSEDGITDWVIRRKNGENIHLDKTQPVEIRRGSHCADASFEFGTNADENRVEVGEQFTLAASSSGSDAQYNWDFDGDGQFEVQNSTNSSLTHTYDGSVTGDVSVTLMIEDGSGFQNSVTKQIRVEPRQPPQVSATIGGTNENSFDDHHVVDETLTFDATNTTDNGVLNASSAVWRVDGEVVARGQMQYTQTFGETGNHEVSFTVSDEAGLDATETMNFEVEEIDTESPDPSAEMTPQEVEAGASVTFDASETDDNRGIAEYRWDFTGNDEFTTSQNATVQPTPYESPGTYNVTLEVEDANGNVDNTTVPVTVIQGQDPNFTRTEVPDDVSVNEQFTVSAEAEDNGRVASITYSFSNGGSQTVANGESVSHTFESAGTGVVEIVARDEAGNANTTGEITVNVTTAPNAALSVSPNETKTGNEVTFDASGSTDSDGSVVEYRWDFDGDGQIEQTTNDSQPTVSNQFDSSGTYDATVTVVDDSNLTDTATARVQIDPDEQAQRDSSGGSSVSMGPPPVNKETEQTGPNSAAIDVRNVRGGETIRSDLPASDVASETGVTFDSVAVDVARDDPHVVFETAASAESPEGTAELSETDETLAYLDLGARYLDRGVKNATVEFTIQQSALPDLSESSDVVVYQYDGGWSQVSATVVETTDDAYRYSATTDGLGTLAVGTNQPVSVTDAELANSSVTTGERLTATATVENSGTDARSSVLNFTLDGNVVASETVDVPAGEQKEVTLTGTAPTNGTYEASVGGVSLGTLTVQDVQPADVSVADVSLNESSIEAGNEVAITATVENSGGEAGETPVALTMFDEELENETVRVEGGEKREVTFVRRVDAAGTYTVNVNGETVSLEVTESEDDGLGDAAPDVPGFGVGAALVALLAAALLARLRS